MSNMDIWNAVNKTDPAHTKKVAQRGGFTAIDAHYQVMRATEHFGPVGEGWGYDCEHGMSDDLQLAWCDVWVWWRGNTGEAKRMFGPIRGMCKCKTNDRIDQDAGKKAMTDALTKGLSHLGFSADVFLGLFDDNKYVAQRAAEENISNQEHEDKEWLIKVLMRMSVEAEDKKELAAMEKKINERISKMNDSNKKYFQSEYEAILSKLIEKEKSK